jgi:RNase P subunit RPR2
MHDQCVQILKEYSDATAHTVKVPFKNKEEAELFTRIADEQNTITALQAIGRLDEANRVMVNTITLAMVSDNLHHIYEGLRCMEKRKSIVALNILRKPLLDSLVYLSWMLGDEPGFLEQFSKGEPELLAHKLIANHRGKIISQALEKTEINKLVDAEFITEALFNKKNPQSLQLAFQHSAHLITIQNIELETTPVNFNFIFKNPADDDVYEGLYLYLPTVLLYLSHVILGLFNRMRSMDEGAKTAFNLRSIMGHHLLDAEEGVDMVKSTLEELLANQVCGYCKSPLAITRHNAARLTMTETFRCTHCNRHNYFPLSWLF